MVTSVAVKDGKAYFRNKFVVTEDFDEEERTGKYIKKFYFPRRIETFCVWAKIVLMICWVEIFPRNKTGRIMSSTGAVLYVR